MQMSGGHLLVSGSTETTPYIPRSGMAIESRSPIPSQPKGFDLA